MTGLTCAAAPCKSCPYRRDVPSGVWHQSEYDKLTRYDGEILDQVLKGASNLFLCHQRDGQLCAGWVAAHGPDNLLALRLHSGEVDPTVWEYETSVPVFSSGQEACDHGKRDVDQPALAAVTMATRLAKKLPPV